MRISDRSSDVCSSDLFDTLAAATTATLQSAEATRAAADQSSDHTSSRSTLGGAPRKAAKKTTRSASTSRPAKKAADRKSGASGKSVSVRVDLGGRSIIIKKK